MPSGQHNRSAAAEQPAVAPQQATALFESRQVETVPSNLDLALEQSTALFQQLQPGQMLGQYRILERLGAGGMGEVYKAVHSAMDRTVALKIIAPRFMQEASVRARFQREVRNAARLMHPNVVVAYDAAEVGGLWFLVMEYIEGRDLASLMFRHGRPPLGLACEIIRQAAVGLQYAHELGMVHRDIKPANLIVTSARPLPAGARMDGWLAAPLVKILDFGLARLTAPDGEGLASADGVTREGCMVGTPEYMAPEQARDSRLVDIRSDIYSLGCTLYALLAGRPPFRASSSFEIIVMHLRQPPERIERYCPGIPGELAAVAHRMLAKEPRERFQTPGEVAAALQPWAQFAAAPSPVPTPVVPSTPVAAPAPAPPANAPGSAVPPSPVPAQPTPPQPAEPVIPPRVLAMHFQAMLRTIMLILIVGFLVAGCAMYLPDIGQYVLQLWNKVAPHPTKTTPPPRR